MSKPRAGGCGTEDDRARALRRYGLPTATVFTHTGAGPPPPLVTIPLDRGTDLGRR
jgi:hypothetical protein